MKKHIVRTQQTDRYLLPVPEAAGDMRPAYGLGQTSVDSFSSGEAPSLSPSTFTVDGMVEGAGGGFEAVTAGLYLVIITATWVFSSAGAPNIARTVGYDVNGTGFVEQVTFDNDCTGTTGWDDQASWLVRLAAGDVIKPCVTSDPGFGWDVSAKIQVAQISS